MLQASPKSSKGDDVKARLLMCRWVGFGVSVMLDVSPCAALVRLLYGKETPQGVQGDHSDTSGYTSRPIMMG